MKAIITGAAGFIGSHLAARLAEHDWTLLPIDSAGGSSIQEVEDGLPSRFHRPAAIFHLASPVGPVGVLHRAGRISHEIADTTRIVASWALRAACPLIFTSTSEVYGSGSTDHEDDVCTFTPHPTARKEYALAKLAAETSLLNTPDLDVRIIRPFNVAGARQKVDGGFVLPRFVNQALDGEPLTVYTPGTQRRAFTHVADIVDGLLAAYDRGKPGCVYNLGNPANECSIQQLAHEVIELADAREVHTITVDPRLIHGPLFAEAPDKIPNADRANRELDWWPTRTRASTIADVINYERWLRA